MNDKTYSRIIGLIFVLNAVFLTWAILWKCGIPFIGDGTQRAINLVPFNGNTNWEMQFNIMLFVPFGFLLSVIMKKRIHRQFLAVLSTSVFLEIVQYIFAVGLSDITDLLLNTLGGVIGIGAYYLFVRLFGKYSRTAVMVVCVLIAVFELYVSASFILFGAVRLGSIMFKI